MTSAAEGTVNVSSKNMALGSEQLGYVLVWDMDHTITGNYFDVMKYTSRELDINPKALEILQLAIKARNEGRVAAILLLTNNSDKDYVFKMIKTLSQKLNVSKVFDGGTMAGNSGRIIPPGKTKNHAIKSLRDVKRMLQSDKLSIENLAARTFFIDDQLGHVLTDELDKKNFIHITPGYKEGVTDATDWSFLESVLKGEEQSGGYRSKKKRVKGYTKHIKRVFRAYRKTRSKQKRGCA